MPTKVTHEQIHQRAIEILKYVMEKVADVCDPERIRKIATEQFSYKEIASKSDKEFCPCAILKVKPVDKYDAISPLAIAVILGNDSSLQILLRHFDNHSINDEESYIWGYRQYYTLLHYALDPVGRNLDILPPNVTKEYISRMKTIIKMLAQLGLNPNQKPNDLYNNPPMAAGEPRHWGFLNDSDRLELKALLLAVGADPGVIGSSYTCNFPLYAKGMLEILSKESNPKLNIFKGKLSLRLCEKTGKRVFTYHFYSDYERKVEIGNISFSNHPLPCISSNNATSTNFVVASGACRDLMPANISAINRTCDAALEVNAEPLTLLKVETSSLSTSILNGATLGVLRGTSQLVEHALNSRGYLETEVKLAKQLSYYGGLFLWRLFNKLQLIDTNNGPENQLAALYQAAFETGTIMIINETLEKVFSIIEMLLDTPTQKKVANGLKCLSLFASVSTANDLVGVVTEITAGAVTELTITSVGSALLR